MFQCFCINWVAVCNVKWSVVRENSHCTAMAFLLYRLLADIVLTCSWYSKWLFLYYFNWITVGRHLYHYHGDRPSAPLCICDSFALSMWPNCPHWCYLLCLWGWMGHLLSSIIVFGAVLSYLYWGSSVWVKPLNKEDMEMSKISGRQGLESLRLLFQVGSDHLKLIYLFLYLICFNRLMYFM